MTTITRLDPVGNFKITRDSVRVLETQPELKTFCLAPNGALVLDDYTFTFPEPRKDNWYDYNGASKISEDDFGFENWTGGCSSYTALVGEEWGPGRAQNISDVLLGQVTPYTDYVDVRVKLTRTAAPSAIMGNSIPTICKGEWMSLEGGGSVIEGWPTMFVREVDVVLDHPGEAVVKAYLRLKQSIRRLTLPTVGSTSTPGWTVLVSNVGIFANLVSNQNPTSWYNIGPPPSGWLQRGGSGGCSQGTTGNYASTYSGSIEITPGRVSSA